MRKKNQNGATPFSWQIAKIGGKNDFPSVKISQDREMVQNWIFDMLFLYNEIMI